MICPQCGAEAFQVDLSLELLPDSANDEIALQTVVCRQCGLQALAVYRESRRGALPAEAWHHDGYRVSTADFQRVRKLIQSCPQPGDKRCSCPAHQQLGQQSGFTWVGLEVSGLEIEGVFDIQLRKF